MALRNVAHTAIALLARGESSNGSDLTGEVRRLEEVADEARKLGNDAEFKLGDKEQAKDLSEWLRKLQEATHDLEDVLDDLRYVMERRRRQRPEHEGRRKSIRHLFSPSSTDHGIDYKKVKMNIENVNKKFHGILQRGRDLALQPVKVQRQNRISEFPGDLPPQHALVGDIEQEKTKLINKLTDSQSTSAVVAIFGLGGIGKTTLARSVHDDFRIKGAFSTVVWVHGSKALTDVELLSAILSSSGGKPGEAETMEEIQDMLTTILGAKRFLLVLDDVWDHQIHEKFLEDSLRAQQGSRILLTTQDEKVVGQMASDCIHKVNELSFSDCLSLLFNSACLDEQDCGALRDIGIMVIQKCNRVPLAIKVMGGLLGTKNPTREDWQQVMMDWQTAIEKSEKWALEDIPDGLKEICVLIYLAYNNLSYHLKLCFRYCLQLPEGSVIRQRIVSQLWISEGFIEEQDNCNPEDIAEEYYKELVLRNLVQPEIGSFDMSRCTVHDCVKSLLQPFIKDTWIGNSSSAAKAEETEILTSFRTAIVYKNPSGDRGLEKVFRMLKNLRSLDLTGTGIRYIPKSLVLLYHLRLLNLSLTQILELPESIESLRNLQFLILRYCHWLHTLPEEISNLVSLRSLDLEGTTPHTVLPRLAALEELTTLHGFIVSHNHNTVPEKDHQSGWLMEDLKPLNSLRSLQITNIDRVADISVAQEAALARKSRLTHLELCGSSTSDTQVFVPEEEAARWLSVLTGLRPPRCLEYLKIASYHGKSFPDWIVHLPNLLRLVLTDCKLCDSLPALGQLPQLKFLTINECPKLRIIDQKRGTSTLQFPKLEQLELNDMQNFESWKGFKDGDLPSLIKFHLESSPKLRSLPSGIGYSKVLTSVKIVGVDSLQVIDNLPVLNELVVEDNKRLVTISNLPRLQVLVVIDCSTLQYVKGVECLRHVRIVDKAMKELPDWLTGHASVLQTFTLVGTKELLCNLVPERQGWSVVRNIDRVYGNLPDGTPFLAYNKGRTDFLLISSLDHPQLKVSQSAQVTLKKLDRMASQIGIGLVLLLLATRDVMLVRIFLTFSVAMACVAGGYLIYTK